ncbi:hypothetical protein [Erythrobacter sp.]|nr:hypothetical protein [Erythrobacter sp.]
MTDANFESGTVRMKRWQAICLLALSGFAIGTILARTAGALGF